MFIPLTMDRDSLVLATVTECNTLDGSTHYVFTALVHLMTGSHQSWAGEMLSQLGGLLQCKLTGDRMASSVVQSVTSLIQLGDRKEQDLITWGRGLMWKKAISVSMQSRINVISLGSKRRKR